MANDREKILEKIQKCLALAKSGNEHEAATALRQARALMENHGVTDKEMLALGVSEKGATAGAVDQPAQWESNLAMGIAYAFGCRILFSRTGWSTSEWVFIGCGPSAEIAAYAFDVLFRQAKKARKAHIDEQLRRFKKANKTRRADLFCHGWVATALSAVTAWVPGEANKEAIEAYMGLHHNGLKKLESRDRNAGRTLSDKDYDSLAAGRQSGRSAEINRGVGAAPAPLALEG